jgi:hypothetical protein
MKKMLFFAAAVLALTACSNEEENTNKDWNEEIRLCTQNLMMTRAGSDIQSTQFAANEQIDVFVYDVADQMTYTRPAVYTADGQGGLTTSPAQLWPSGTGSAINLYAFYPSGAVKEENFYGPEDEIQEISFAVEQDQSTEAGYKASDLMFGGSINPNGGYQEIARTNSTVPLTFYHMLSKINLNVTLGEALSEQVNSISSISAKIQNVSPEAQFFGIISSSPLQPSMEWGGDPIDINVGNLTRQDGLYSGSAIIPPQMVESGNVLFSITITYNDNSSRTLTYTPSGDGINFDSHYVYNFNITANVWGLSLSTTIEPWSQAQDYSGETD